ncbi:F-box/FBD-like domains containing protein [Striga asiatica]|uniref:F-box/FBD-like domains containing protein n=1 Tax=Striga asiatica TaxID=4170 RepID=A0A5A7QS39_STRAF|nr:F-box/FBD-like domains containing protein [Striga asiatica]
MRTGAEHTPKNPSMVESSSSRKDIAASHGRTGEKSTNLSQHINQPIMVVEQEPVWPEEMCTELPNQSLMMVPMGVESKLEVSTSSKQKTWKRSGNKVGRLQRNQRESKGIQLQGMKRGRQGGTTLITVEEENLALEAGEST